MKRFLLPLLVILLFLSGCSGRDMTPEEKNLLVTLADFDGLGLTLPENPAALGEYKRTAYPDGSRQLEYEYSSGEGENVDIPFLTMDIYFEASESDARGTLTMINGVWNVFLKTQDFAFVEVPGLWSRPGADVTVWSLVNDAGTVLGSRMVYHRKAHIIDFVIVGVDINDPALWEALFGEKLDRLEAME